MEIKNFEELIKPTLKKGEKFVSYECDKLLSTGENYGSVMLKVQVKILNGKGEEETLHYVGKTSPPSDFLWNMFNTSVTFKKEVAVYSTIVPMLNEYGKEKGIDRLINFMAEYITARISLNPQSDVVDKDCLLLLENITVKGYKIGDRFTGFDLETTKLLLRDLATLHASTIAFKLEKPDDFAAKIRPYLNKDLTYPDEEEEGHLDSVIKQMQDAVKTNPNCLPYLSKIDQHHRSGKYNEDNPIELDELYATFTHNDFWVNNTMVKYENGKPAMNKIVDFQIAAYDSLAQDVIFFLYTSVELSVLEERIDDLMRFYYDRFVEILNRLGSDASKYTYDGMLVEFGRNANHYQFAHILYMLFPILTIRGKAKDLSEVKVDDILTKNENLHENYFKRMQFLVMDFGRRKWI